MSDRPMRLKYLTKMKIILCIFLLCITAVSVFGESQELNGVVGKSIEFPAAVKIDGSLRYRSVTIGDMTSGRFTTPDKYKDSVHWDSSTGFFSLSELRLEDSGVYNVQNDGQKSVSFNLTVWEDNVPVSKPQVSFTHDEYPCTILCAAARGTEVTLSWYREGQKKPYGSYPVRSAPDLYLPQTVHEGGIYTCEAKNSVSNEKASITVGAHCTAGLSTGTIVGIIFAVFSGVIAVLAVPSAVVFALKYRHEQAVLLEVKKNLQNVVLLANDEEKVEVPPLAIRSLIKVIELLGIGPPHGENSSAFIQYVIHGLASQDTKSELEVKDEQPLFRDVRDFIFYRNAPKVMASFPQTEFLLNQTTPEVGTASAPAGGNH